MAESLLFSPGRIGRLEPRNRIILAAMGTAYAERDGSVSERLIHYLARRARGGAGVVVTEAAAVDASGAPFPGVLRADDDRYVEGLGRLARAVKAEGAAAVLQLYHAGRQMSERVTGRQPVAPSAIPCLRVGSMPRALEAGEIEALVERFADAAVRARAAGFDGIELHGGHGYLLHQFLSPLSNRRTDTWGGSLHWRAHFPVEVVRRIRERVGADLAIIYKISAEDGQPGGLVLDDTLKVGRWLEGAGVDALVASDGTYVTFERIVQPIVMPEGCLRGHAAAFKQVLGIPVVAVGRITQPALAEEILQSGDADFVALGRALLADPDWPEKARARRAEEIRPCITCNECLARLFHIEPVRCSVNPETGNEARFPAPAARPRWVLVVGGGPAGLQAAIVARERGHHVTLLEAGKELGGQLRLADRAGYKQPIARLTAWLARRAYEVGVEVQTGVRATAEQIKAMGADVVVLATGARPAVPGIPGVTAPHVKTAQEWLAWESEAPEDAVVIGEGQLACEAATVLAERGARATILAAGREVGLDIEPVTRRAVAAHLEKLGVRVRASVWVERVDGPRVHFTDATGAPGLVTGSLILLALGAEPDDRLKRELEALGVSALSAGDCTYPGNVAHAIHAATELALGL